MNLNDYFNPVSLEKPDFSHLKAENTISRSVTIHTPDNPIPDIRKYDVAIIGIKEDSNAFIKGSASGPDKIREKLYLLSGEYGKTKTIDLGNLITTDKIADTYFALRDVYFELLQKSVTAIILGGSQDLGIGLAKAFEDFNSFWNFTTIDSRLDFGIPSGSFHSANYLEEIFNQKNHEHLILVNLGHQQYFVPLKLLDSFENKGHSSLRLGRVRSDLKLAEPVLRDTNILSVDINSVRQSDAPGGSSPSPNGFFGHELCQLSRYAGASPHLSALLFSEFIPEKDPEDHTSHLIAQAIWYFIDGFSIRKPEDPRNSDSKKFIVSTSAGNQNMIFYKSNETERWWMELPVKDPLTNMNHIISCGNEDYLMACTNEIPDRWWKFMRKFS